MKYEPSEKEKYIRKATEEYAARIRAMFPEAEAVITIKGLKLTELSEIAEPMLDIYGDRINVDSITKWHGGIEHYIMPDIEGAGYQIEEFSE